MTTTTTRPDSSGQDSLRWDSTFPVLRLEGAGARSFLQGQTSADIQHEDVELIQSCWLTATGRLRALLEIQLDDSGANVLVLAGDADAVATGFDQVIFPADRVRLRDAGRQRRLQSLNRSEANQVMWLSADQPLPANWANRLAADPEELEHWRVEQGWPTGDGELNGDTNPFELGLADWVSLSKGCYLGQETMAKLASQAGVKQQLRCWSCTEKLETQQRLFHNEDRAGMVTSVLPKRVNQHWIGLALIRKQWLDELSLHGPDKQLVTISRPHGFQDPPHPDAR